MIGTKIKELRIKNGLTQEDLAMRLLVSPQAVSKWERNLADPDIGLLIPIARIFGKTVDVLLSEVKQEVDIDAMVDCSAVLRRFLCTKCCRRKVRHRFSSQER